MALPLLEWKLVQRADHLNPRVAHEHVDAAELAHGALHAGLDLGFAGDIRGDADSLATGVANLFSNRLRPLKVEVGDGNLRALTGKGKGDAASRTPSRWQPCLACAWMRRPASRGMRAGALRRPSRKETPLSTKHSRDPDAVTSHGIKGASICSASGAT
jgi:hypothetical protein